MSVDGGERGGRQCDDAARRGLAGATSACLVAVVISPKSVMLLGLKGKMKGSVFFADLVTAAPELQ